jgi:uncharacterized protein (DUF58 family)
LLPPGIHRHRRPGSGSELLDLRDYLPGDPPRTIAWKVSARRDRLITKEFESEVPVRCTLFVDTSNSVRVGPPGQNALSRLVAIAAAVAQAAADNRDLTGLCRFDEHQVDYVRPARGEHHLVRVLNLLAEAAVLAPTTSPSQANLEDLLPLAYSFAEEVYPDLLRPDLNSFPFWLPWLLPPPAYTVRQPRLVDYLYPWLPALLPLYGILGLTVMAVGFLAFVQMVAQFHLPGELLLLIAGVAAFLLVKAFLRLPQSLFFPRQRRWLRWRKRLTALLAVRYELAPGGLALLLENDDLFGQHLQRFLADHHVPYPLSLYDPQGRYLFAAPDKVEVLAGALLRAIGKGHDNELFVLLADLLELSDKLAPLLRAVKVALARHHRVLVVCPWPPGIPPPSAQRRSAGQSDASKETTGLRWSIQQTTTERFHRAYQHLRRTFASLGVPVVCAESGDPAQLILERLDLLRELGRKR